MEDGMELVKVDRWESERREIMGVRHYRHGSASA